MKKTRLNQKILRIDPRLGKGYYSDKYFNREKEVLDKDGHKPVIRMQVFQKNDKACICGIDEAICMLKESLGDDFKKLKVKALNDGDIANAWETVMVIEGDASLFAHLETVYLGALARGTRVATNVYRCFEVSNGKPILFFPARFDTYLTQAKDGYSFLVGKETVGRNQGNVSTDAQGDWWGSEGVGTMPHALIAAYGGNTVKAALKFAEHIDPKIKRIVLVDYENDCVQTSLDVAEAMLTKYKETNDKRYKLFGVRLDTSGNMVDRSVREDMAKNEYLGSFKPTGVNPRLVENVDRALKERAASYAVGSLERKFYEDIGIVVSGGFKPDKIKMFEDMGLPIAAYGVGSSMFDGNFDFTADIVQVYEDGEWKHNAKKGRRYSENPKLEEVL